MELPVAGIFLSGNRRLASDQMGSAVCLDWHEPIVIYLISAWFPFKDLANKIAGGPIKFKLGHWGEAWVCWWRSHW
jgi:hypothetical protein